MNQHDDQHDDQQLRVRLRAGDPASSLAPVDPERAARLLEAAMTETPDRRRAALTWMAAAAAVVVGGVVLAAALGTDRGGGSGEDDVPAVGSTVLRLEAPPATVGRCAIPSAELLAAQDVAFLGTVREVGEGAVELTVEESYAGTEASTVEIAARPADVPSTVGEVDFREGERYLVSAIDGRVTPCGASGPVTPQREALYDEAFGG